MANLFRPAAPQQPTPPAVSLRIQTSLDGKPRAIIWGVTRIATNLLWYGDFKAIAQQSGSSGGKGFGASSGPQTYQYSAAVVMALGEGVIASINRVWNGKTVQAFSVSTGGKFIGIPGPTLNLSLFTGTSAQAAWTYLTTLHPNEALAYRRTAYLGAGPMSLGGNPELPNLTFEVTSSIANAAAGIADANPGDMLADFLSNTIYGVPGWLSSFNGDWSVAKGYWLASGLLTSYALTDFVTANEWAKTFCESLNADAVWSDKLLKLVPRGDQPITAGAVTASSVATSVPNLPASRNNLQAATGATFVSDGGVKYTGSGMPLVRVGPAPGVTNAFTFFLGAVPLSAGQYGVSPSGLYTFANADIGQNITISFSSAALASYNPPAAPLFDLTDADYLPSQGGGSSGGTSGDPVAGVRKAPREQFNVIKLEYLDRSSDYNTASLTVQNPAAIALYGKRTKDISQWHWFQLLSAAQQAAQLALGREQIRNRYTVTVRPRFILLDPGDLVTLTDVNLGLLRQWVRILDVQENSDRSLTWTVEEYLYGTGAAPLYGQQANTGYRANYNADPGALNPPIIFEPTDQLGGGLEIWLAVCGQNTALYGGCDAYISYDGVNYAAVPNGHQLGPARMGTLTADLAAVTINQTGATIDQSNMLSVDISESGSQLISGSNADALALNTACYVDGEIIAYQTAVLTGTGKYDLSYLVRGAFGTEDAIVIHKAGSAFARLDQGILKIPYDQSRIGATIYLKLVPFNPWGGGGHTTADVSAYTYVITGAALASPLPQVQNVRTVFEAGFTKIWWDEVVDFRNGVRYIVKKGDTFHGAQQLGDLAHPPFIAFGSGTYWIEAFCQPVAGLLVYSEAPSSITISGNMLVANLLTTIDFQALGWPGSYTNVAKEGVDPAAFLRLDSTTNFLSNPDILNTPDILNSGGIALSGIYQTAQSTWVDVGYVAQAYVNISWLSTGLPVGQNILTIADFLNAPDILAAASAQFVNVWVEISFATDAGSDVFGLGDVFSEPDVFTSGIRWSAWQRFVPGVYLARWLRWRVIFETVDATIIAYALAFSAEVSIAPRIDHYLGNTVPVGGLTITFEPDNAAAPSPFNGGPQVGGLNNHPLPSVTMDWPGNPLVNFVIDSLTLSALTLHFEDNSGSHVQVTSVDTIVEGY